MGGETGDQTTTQEPWDPQQPYLQDVYSQARQTFNANPTTPYEFQRTADPSGATEAGENYALGYAQDLAPKQFDAVNQTFQRNLNASDVGNNPILANAANAAIDPIYDNLQERILPQIGSQAIQSGAYGGARQGVIESSALKDTNEVAANTLANFYGNAYQNGVQTESQTINQAAGVNQLGLQPGIIAGQVGSARDDRNQSLINDSMDRYYEGFQYPWQDLANYSSNIQGNVGQTTTAPGPQGPSRGQTALSGAALGAQTGNPWLAAAGAAGGYLLGGG